MSVEQTSAAPPKRSFAWSLYKVSQCSDQQRELLKGALLESLESRLSESSARELASRLNWDERNVRRVVSDLDAIYQALRPDAPFALDDKTAQHCRDDFIDLLDRVGGLTDEMAAEITQAVFPLLATSEDLELALKKSRVVDGFTPRAARFSSLVDVRPVFNYDQSEIIDVVTCVTFRIEFEKPNGEVDALALSLDLQLIEQFIGALNTAKAKAAAADRIRTQMKSEAGATV